MSFFALFALLPVWALALTVGISALRLRRSSGLGLAVLCLTEGVWMTALLLFDSRHGDSVAERALPAGIFEGAAFFHAGLNLARKSNPKQLFGAYFAAAAVAAVGVFFPRAIYQQGAHGAGPLFLPLGLVASVVTAALNLQLLQMALAARGADRRRFLALLGASILAATGGGGVLILLVEQWGPFELAAPFMFVSTLLATYALLDSEEPVRRRLILRTLSYAYIAAAISSVGLAGYAWLLPSLLPAEANTPVTRALGALFLSFMVALPLDALRQAAVETLGRRLFRDPIGTVDLAVQVEASEVRADHAERLAEIGAMASAVAHEIRNPLGVIAAHAKLLEKSGASEKSVRAVRAEVEKAKRFLDDLLHYSRPRPLELARIDLLPVVQRALCSATLAHAGTAPEIEVEVAADLQLVADERAIEDVLRILLINACIAVDGRAHAKVTVRASARDDTVEIEVSDNGEGVPEEIKERLFQPFVTGRSRDSAHPGTGLGLAIAARWVERHSIVNGPAARLAHHPSSSGGASFVVTLPRTR